LLAYRDLEVEGKVLSALFDESPLRESVSMVRGNEKLFLRRQTMLKWQDCSSHDDSEGTTSYIDKRLDLGIQATQVRGLNTSRGR